MNKLEGIYEGYGFEVEDGSSLRSNVNGTSGSVKEKEKDLAGLAEGVAKAFVESVEKGVWSVYEEFCAGHSHAMALLRSYANTKTTQWTAFEKFCSDKLDPPLPSTTAPSSSSTRTNKHRLTFQDYLIMPVQRICKYPLLLSAAFNSIPSSSHTTRLQLQQKAMEAMKGVIMAVDRREGEERMRTVRRRLGLVTANGNGASTSIGSNIGGGGTGSVNIGSSITSVSGESIHPSMPYPHFRSPNFASDLGVMFIQPFTIYPSA